MCLVELARDNKDRKLPAYPLLYYYSSCPFFAFIFFHCAQQQFRKQLVPHNQQQLK
jgi:hypothetical protein